MSSIIFLGFSVVVFVITYGMLFLLTSAILGTFFSSFSAESITDPAWQDTHAETEEVVRWLIPILPTIGIFIFIIKVLMVSSVRGEE